MSHASIRDHALLDALEPEVERLLERHLGIAQEWFPHDYIPYSLGRDFDKEPWTPDHSRLTGIAQTAFEVNLLTEDNLPSYHREIDAMFGKRDSAWTTWVNRWTAEEGRHSIVLRDYLVVTRAVDPVALERGRMQQLETAYYADGKDTLHGMAYVAFQELATRVAHRNTGRYSQDPVADRIMARISADENLHMVFYRDALQAAYHLDPSAATIAIADEVLGFEMPGAGMTNFTGKALKMAQAGIYDLRGHRDDVVQPLLKYWGFFEAEGLSAEAEEKRTQVHDFLAQLDKMAAHYDERRAARQARMATEREPERAGQQ